MFLSGNKFSSTHLWMTRPPKLIKFMHYYIVPTTTITTATRFVYYLCPASTSLAIQLHYWYLAVLIPFTQMYFRIQIELWHYSKLPPAFLTPLLIMPPNWYMVLSNFITTIPAVETVPAHLGFPGAADIQKNMFDLRKEHIIFVKSIN